MKKINFVRYPSINECLAAYYRCGVDQIPTTGFWEYKDADGKYHKTSQKKALKSIRARAAWGWVEKKRTVHFYCKKNVSMRQLIRLFAHEIGHTKRPWHKSLQEEKKACLYGDVAMMAYDVAKEVIKNNYAV